MEGFESSQLNDCEDNRGLDDQAMQTVSAGSTKTFVTSVVCQNHLLVPILRAFAVNASATNVYDSTIAPWTSCHTSTWMAIHRSCGPQTHTERCTLIPKDESAILLWFTFLTSTLSYF